jgi:hypothetical protein
MALCFDKYKINLHYVWRLIFSPYREHHLCIVVQGNKLWESYGTCICMYTLCDQNSESYEYNAQHIRTIVTVAGLFPWSLQLQAQVRLASLRWWHNLWECVDQRVSAVGVVEVPVLVCLRSSCNQLSEGEDRKVCENRAEGCHAKCRGLYGCDCLITN